MTKQQALEELKKGKNITHRFFLPNEFIKMDQIGRIVFENDVKSSVEEFFKYRQSEFWNDGYEYYFNQDFNQDFKSLNDEQLFHLSEFLNCSHLSKKSAIAQTRDLLCTNKFQTAQTNITGSQWFAIFSYMQTLI